MTMETANQIERGETRWVHSPDDTKEGRHLTRFGYTGVGMYREVLYAKKGTKKQTEQALRAKVAALPQEPEANLMREYAEKALAIARAHRNNPVELLSQQYPREIEVIEAMYVMDEANWPYQPDVIQQPTCCRHGVPLTADCGACDEGE